jgi:exopolysaccharide biosynthesis polyprenyl glycosylphosphotransferase
VTTAYDAGPALTFSARVSRPTGAPRASSAAQAARSGRRTSALLVAADVLAVSVALSVALSTAPVVNAWTALIAIAPLTLLATAGLYRPRLSLSLLDDLPVLLGAGLAAAGLAAVGLALSGTIGGLGHVVHTGLHIVLALAVARYGTYLLVRAARRRGRLGRRAVVVGCGEVGARLVEGMRAKTDAGLHPVGFVDERPLVPAGARPAPVLGRLSELPGLLRAGAADVVVVAYADVAEMAMVDVLRACDGTGVEVLSVPRFFELRRSRHGDEHVAGISLVRLRRPPSAAVTWPLKRVMDVVVAGLGLVLASPLLALIALAVRLEGGPGVLFRQQRSGLGGTAFTLLKFRSMRPASTTESDTTWSIASDDRVGSVGRALRRLSLDELPQLWNVVRGDMSLVGPRPERPHFLETFCLEHEEYTWRHRVPVGLTGWAQVHGLRGDTSIRDRARYDNAYIENWSLWLDVKIMLRTARQLLKGA